MMNQHVIARRYAKGLVLSAPEQNLELLERSLMGLSSLLRDENSDLSRLFCDPNFSPSERKAVVKRVADKYDCNQMLLQFLLLLADKDRMMLLPQIHQALRALIDEKRGRMRAEIKSASPLTPTLIEEIKMTLSAMTKRDVEVVTSVNEELLGGIRVEIGGKVFDGSLKAKLEAMKNQLVYEV